MDHDPDASRQPGNNIGLDSAQERQIVDAALTSQGTRGKHRRQVRSDGKDRVDQVVVVKFIYRKHFDDEFANGSPNSFRLVGGHRRRAAKRS